ncbi:exopolysaccharide biosynthesis protein [Pseudomonas saliphila]|uniref:exopolysaccharide biosynthesis protein n=1 Tax=Pseudomonas saliphila TaxID=2586906 RepID=UPI00123C24FA|nr:exopolysaccharide biosynthesis protein [Pseudomonas saliphila]
MRPPLRNLQQLLDHLARLNRGRDEVSLRLVVESIGTRSFGPLLMLVGIILASPLSGIPGMATTMALFILLIAVQMLLGRNQFWLPQWLLSRSVKHDHLIKAISWVRPVARRIDAVLRPRLTVLVTNSAAYVIALICVLISIGLPMMEIIPFSASIVGLALTAFGLSLVVNDGLLVILAVVLVCATFGLAVVNIL